MEESIKQKAIDKAFFDTLFIRKGRNLIEELTSSRRIVKLYKGK